MAILHADVDLLPGKLKLGSGDISKVYLGDNEIWPSIPESEGFLGGASGAGGGGKSVSMPFGTPAADRVVVALITVHDGDPATLSSSVSIGGVSATVIKMTSPGSRIAIGMFAALVPTGNSGNVVWTGSGGADYWTVQTYNIYGVPVTPQFSVNDTGAPFTQNPLPAAYSIAVAQNWTQAGGSIGNFAAPWVQDQTLAPQGVVRCAHYSGGDVQPCTISISNPNPYTLNLIMASWQKS